MKGAKKRNCHICWVLITEENERIDCPFGGRCTVCDICHRLVESAARNEGLRMHAEWVRQRNSAGLSA